MLVLVLLLVLLAAGPAGSGPAAGPGLLLACWFCWPASAGSGSCLSWPALPCWSCCPAWPAAAGPALPGSCLLVLLRLVLLARPAGSVCWSCLSACLSACFSACSAWRCLRVRVRTVVWGAGSSAGGSARGASALRRLGPRAPRPVGASACGASACGATGRRPGGLDGVDELGLLHRAGAGDAEADGHRLEVGQQHRVEAARLGGSLLGGLLRRSGLGGLDRGSLGHVGPSHVASPTHGRERPARRMVVARARGQMDRVGRVRRTARRQVSSSGAVGLDRQVVARPAVGTAAGQVGGVGRAEGQHRRARTRHHGGYAVGAEAAYERERLGHGGLALVLVQPVAGGGEQVLGLAGEGGDEQRGAPGVGRRVGVRDGLGQQPAGDRGLDAGRRHEGDRGDPRVDAGADGVPAVVLAPGDHEAAEERGRHVVGVALEVGGEVEERLVGGEQLAAGDERRGRARRRRRSRPTTSRGRGRAG